MRKKIFANIAVSAVAFTAVCLPLATPTSAASCDDVKFIFARGSGQSLDADDYQTYKHELELSLNHSNSNLSYSFYELGSASHGGAKYPAIDLSFFKILGAKVSAGSAFAFGKSVNQGITELTTYVEEISSACPNTKFVLAGYSQGAMVITNSIDKLNPSKVIYAATFGDPKLYLPEGKGLIPSACLGKNLSPYRIYAPNCYTTEGSLGGKIPYQPATWASKIGLWCKDKDLVCGAGVGFSSAKGDNLIEKIISSAMSSHTAYASDGIYKKATSTIISKVKQAYPTKIASKYTPKSNRDTVFLFDRTGSMSSLINEYQAKALKIARETLSAGGRVALYTYGDLKEGEHPERLADFGCNFDTFKTKLENVKTSGGGDDPESALSALLYAMNNQTWRAGAIKSIVLITDAAFHNPDIDAVTLPQVVKRSLEIDPVNVYVINLTATATAYQDLVAGTNGNLYQTLDDAGETALLDRPSVSFILDAYSGAPGSEFTFSLETSENIVKYEWDLDGDGIFETTSADNSINKTYSSEWEGFVQARITDINGSSSTASAHISITSASKTLPKIHGLSAVTKSGVSKVAYDYSEDTAAVIVSLDDAFLGLTSEKSLEIADLSTKSTLILTPVSTSGRLGDPVSIDLEPEPLAPKTGQK